jgi:membrane protein implicated in regulation of membrane protease activity
MPREVSRITVKYGYRTIGLLVALAAFAAFLLAEYFISGGIVFFLVFSIIIFVITIFLFIGFSLTTSSRITKKYFHPENLVGKTGKVLKGVPAGEPGTVTVVNEDWSFICDSDTSDGDMVTVVEVLDDKVTLKVRKVS